MAQVRRGWTGEALARVSVRVKGSEGEDEKDLENKVISLRQGGKQVRSYLNEPHHRYSKIFMALQQVDKPQIPRVHGLTLVN